MSKGIAKFVTQTKKVRIVGVDPGQRNLVIVKFDFDTATRKAELVSATHKNYPIFSRDLDCIEHMTRDLQRCRDFAGADYISIENQMIGPRTLPRNQGIGWLLSTIALVQAPGAQLLLPSSKAKFACYKKAGFKFRHKPSELGKGNQRRRRIKENSIYCCQQYLESQGIDAGLVLPRSRPWEWEHFADAVGMSFVAQESEAGACF